VRESLQRVSIKLAVVFFLTWFIAALCMSFFKWDMYYLTVPLSDWREGARGMYLSVSIFLTFIWAV